MKAEFTKHGPKHDYRGAHVVDATGRLAEIVGMYRRELPYGCTMAKLRRFNGEVVQDQPLGSLEILERDYV